MFAFVDETGNTGGNLLDEQQPEFFTAALITKSDFDMVYSSQVAKLAKKFGDGPLHGKELGFGRCEEIVFDLHKIFKKADARFFVSRVEKRYLLATKIFDTFFDSGENAAASWHNYNIRPLRVILALKVATIVDEDVGRRFWTMLLDRSDARQKQAIPVICQALIDRVDDLPDQRSRDIVAETLSWARDNPETIHVHLDSRQARNGHMPNMVAFANLLDGLEGFSKRWDRRVRRITHDRQGEFDKTLAEWHDLYSHASADPVEAWVGETHVFQKVVGSEFEVKADSESAGIQAIDIVLWLFLQRTRGAGFPRECARLLNYALKHAYMSDFSFEGVSRRMDNEFGEILRGELSPEVEAKARELMALSEQRRQESMEQYKRDGITPFMRGSIADGAGKVIEAEPMPSR
ncbi:DUF3800 domain-containing protein [Bradyrhizobium tropiciagri]|uniref:DUF3800 domain-containing protein n=1 Tax=Bradyrhizobium tropiciagri TaxID=312253 RepID=UPI001BA49680|nr:DUF3800 domain-containing protein [Bradyrhizobium tropiciagri]MBR0899106.1 DUF3800 domain-containing protein [Bradyrhizobium tropiciagri]